MVFAVERPWERITPDRWVYGDLKHPNLNTSILHLGVDNENEAEIFNYRHWPSRLAKPPLHGYWWRRPLEWMEDFPWLFENCVGHWSSGGWLNGRIGSLVYLPDGTIQLQDDPGAQYIYNPGDWPALCRLAFANFSWILVRVLHNGVMQAEIEMHQPVSSPQYLYIDTSTGEVSVRYCPVSPSPCVDLSELARFVPEASGATPATSATLTAALTMMAPEAIDQAVIDAIDCGLLPDTLMTDDDDEPKPTQEVIRSMAVDQKSLQNLTDETYEIGMHAVKIAFSDVEVRQDPRLLKLVAESYKLLSDAKYNKNATNVLINMPDARHSYFAEAKTI
jgi:hypothetical protein